MSAALVEGCRVAFWDDCDDTPAACWTFGRVVAPLPESSGIDGYLVRTAAGDRQVPEWAIEVVS